MIERENRDFIASGTAKAAEQLVNQQRGRRSRGLRSTLFAGALAFFPLWVVGQLVRDWTFLTGLCFYIPSVFLVLLFLGWAAVHLAGRRKRLAALFTSLALLPLGVVLVENQFLAVRAPAATDCVRLVHWNVAGGLSPGAQEILLAQHAEVYILSEVPNERSVESLRAALGSEYRAQVFGNLAVVAAAEVTARGPLPDLQRMNVQALTCLVKGQSLHLLVVDLPSAIHIHRDPLLRRINALIEEHRPDLIVGDFNSPRRSWALCELPDGYRHAFETAGTGCGYTWPVPVPMYALDHCLHSPRILPCRYGLFTSICSDHRMQVFDFALTGDRDHGYVN
jgi:endonuclease/exonuclease/phosphatase (EEP) superfamily protein YafD